MPKVQAISKDEVKVLLDDGWIRLKSGDSITFKQDFKMYKKGDTVKIEPEKKSDMYVLRIWSANHSIRFIPISKIAELYTQNKIQLA